MKPGTVLRFHVQNTKPPKIKLVIVLACDQQHYSFATVFINSEINLHVLNTPKLLALQHALLKTNNPFLLHDSYVDCSNVFLRDCNDIHTVVAQQPKSMIGIVHTEDLKVILERVRNADTTKPNYITVFKFR